MARLRMTIDTVLTPFERNSVMTIHKEKDVYEQLCPTNSKLARDFLLYISAKQASIIHISLYWVPT